MIEIDESSEALALRKSNRLLVSAVRIGKRVRELRLRAGLSQDDLCDRMGISSKGWICNIEAGRKTPRLETLARVCNALGASVMELFNGCE